QNRPPHDQAVAQHQISRRHPEKGTAHRGNHGEHPEAAGEVMSNWPAIKLGDILRRNSDTIALKPDTTYREIVVKWWGKGVVLRREVTGLEIAASNRFVARTDQFIISRIDARKGAIAIVPSEMDGSIVTNDFP